MEDSPSIETIVSELHRLLENDLFHSQQFITISKLQPENLLDPRNVSRAFLSAQKGILALEALGEPLNVIEDQQIASVSQGFSELLQSGQWAEWAFPAEIRRFWYVPASQERIRSARSVIVPRRRS